VIISYDSEDITLITSEAEDTDTDAETSVAPEDVFSEDSETDEASATADTNTDADQDEDLEYLGSIQIDDIDTDDIAFVDTGVSNSPLANTTTPTSSITLEGPQATVYNNMLDIYSEIVHGVRSTSLCTFTVEELGIDGRLYTASDLGLTSLLESDGSRNPDIYSSVLHKISTDLDLNFIVCKLITDHPYESFWLDKSSGMLLSADTINLYRINTTGEVVARVEGSVIFLSRVASCYDSSGVGINVSNAAVFQAEYAHANAETLVDRYADLSDFDKLKAYRDAICEFTDYDFECLANNEPYGDSHQFVNVFDNDPDTKVVCEGYAKAFKILCDLSEFDNNIECILIGGTFTSAASSQSGGHMWNNVIINNNVYLADITNCDFEDLAESEMPFLRNPASGTYTDSYAFNYSNGNTTTYTYSEEMYRLFPAENLIITRHGWLRDNTGWYYKNLDGTYAEFGLIWIDGNYYYFDEQGYMQTGWVISDGSWYYMGSDGAMRTGWQSVNGKWYYLNSDGKMQTGWEQINGTWYYFDGLGRMLTGWQKIGRSWYYFDGLGHMVTGWKKIDGTWYYFNTSGTMQTGWKSIDDTWYYFDGLGKMQTGWKAIGGKWYYFYSSGAMACNTNIGSYRVGADGAWIQ